MSGEDSAPVVANTRTGAVSADMSEIEEEAPIARPARWVASILWFILVIALTLVMLGAYGAAILNFIAPTEPPASSGEMVAIGGGSQSALIALFVNRPGSR